MYVNYISINLFLKKEKFGANLVCILYIQTNFLLLFLFREAIGHMKEGEEEKTKTYSALIWTNKAIQRKDLGFLDDIKVVQCSNSFIFLLPIKESFVFSFITNKS